jgi:hypothetical protein
MLAIIEDPFRGLELAVPAKPLQSLGNGHVKSFSFIE